MRKALFIFVASALSLLAANFKLYLKDGTYQIVKEYKVDGDRLRYYSVERSDWEELPAALVDLRRTEEESAAKKAVIDRQAKELTEEDVAAAELRKEIMKIPQDPGVYRLLDGDQLQICQDGRRGTARKQGPDCPEGAVPHPDGGREGYA